MRTTTFLASAAALLNAQAAHARQKAFPATLAGHALIPANRMIVPPHDAPPGFAASGRFVDRPADNAFILLRVPEPPDAR